MYVNLHNLSPDKAMFTLYVAPHGVPFEQTEEYDLVAPARLQAPSYLTSIVIQEAKDLLVELYGPIVEVRGAINQSDGYIMYDSRTQGYRPIPVVPPARLAQSFDRPYDAFIDLCSDAHDGLGTEQYLDFLTQEG